MLPRLERPPSRLRALPPPPPPPRAKRSRFDRDLLSLTLGVVLGVLAATSGVFVSQLSDRHVERVLAWLAPSPAAGVPATQPRRAEALQATSGRPTVADPRGLPSFVGLGPAHSFEPLSGLGGLSGRPPMEAHGVPTTLRAGVPTTLRAGVAPASTSPTDDLALAARGARIAEASPGWGGGARPDELLDGVRNYDEWAHGHAFGGGPSRWNGEACGERFVEVELAEPARVDRVVVWHHGREHMPAHDATRVEAFVDGAWRTVERRATTSVHAEETEGWWTGWSTPVEHRFDAVTSHRIRYVLDNCEIEHGWLYEIEIYGAPRVPAAT